MPTPRKSSYDMKLAELLAALKAALIARAADIDAHLAYGKLVEAAKAFWPDLQKQLQSPHRVAEPVVVRGKERNGRPHTEDPLPTVRF